MDKLTAQAELIGREKALDMACTEVHNLYALLDDFRIKVPDVDRASYATLDSSYALLKTIMEELDGNKEEAVQKYSAELEAGEQGGTRATHPGDCCDRVCQLAAAQSAKTFAHLPTHLPACPLAHNTHHSASLCCGTAASSWGMLHQEDVAGKQTQQQSFMSCALQVWRRLPRMCSCCAPRHRTRRSCQTPAMPAPWCRSWSPWRSTCAALRPRWHASTVSRSSSR